jgi:hypothetical protein
MIPPETHLQIGSLLFEGLDQIDLTGPFEVLSRIPNSTYRIYGPTLDPVRDVRGLRITPDATLAEAPRLDVLHIPGGQGQEATMLRGRSSSACNTPRSRPSTAAPRAAPRRRSWRRSGRRRPASPPGARPPPGRSRPSSASRPRDRPNHSSVTGR